MSGQAIISPGQQQRRWASGVRIIPTMHMQIKVGSWRYVFYFNFIIFFWVMGWRGFRQLFEDFFGQKTQGQELKDTQMDGRWIQENDGHCVRNCKQDGTSISGWSLSVTGQSTHEQHTAAIQTFQIRILNTHIKHDNTSQLVHSEGYISMPVKNFHLHK